MKLFNKLLKKLNTDGNTFVTYILTLFSVYFIVDRVLEVILMIFTGVSVSYWGPIQYTLALACPVFAFLFSGQSKFAKSNPVKLKLFYMYCITLYIIGISMLVQWLNLIGWLALSSVPNFVGIVNSFPELIKPAFSAIAVFPPLFTFYTLFLWLFAKINDTQKFKESIYDYRGVQIGGKKEATGIYSFEILLCHDRKSGAPVITPEARRFETTLVVGVSGTGKTTLVFEPMMAKDLEKKYFLKEIGKEMGYTSLKTGIAKLKHPYSNDFLNENFRPDMLIPTEGKEALYKAYMKKLVLGENNGEIIYRNCGVTSVSPDFESTSHVMDVADNYNIPYTLIDPENANSIGLNPFIKDDPSQTAIVISSVLRGMYTTVRDEEESFMMNFANQAIENLTILLKEMYPRLNDGLLPNLEDMLRMFNDFSLIEEMCERLKEDEELKRQYSLQLSYFEKNFYGEGVNKDRTEEYIMAASTQLDNLLRYPGVRRILCNRTNNINFDNVLKNGEVVLLCTRRGVLGGTAHKAFGLFFLLLMQYSVLGRPGNEKNRLPHFLYIDEFPDFITRATEPIFTTYRKYRCGTIVSTQTLAQLKAQEGEDYRRTIVSNSASKIIFGGNSPEENQWWEKELGEHREWVFKQDYDAKTGEYESKFKEVKWDWKDNVKAGQIQAMAFKQCAYKTKLGNGRSISEVGVVDFLEDRHKEQHREKTYNYEKFTSGISEKPTTNKETKKIKFNPKEIEFDGDINVDPIKSNTTDGDLFMNSNAISVNFNKNNPEDDE